MNTILVILAIEALLGFLLGYAVSQGSTCAVTAAKELVFERRARRLAGFGVAGGVAGLICLPLAWTLGSTAHLAPEVPIGRALLAGAALLGLGAVVNDACLFGTLSRISQGKLRFLAVPIGLAIGFSLAWRFDIQTLETLLPNAFAVPSPGGIAVVACFAALLAFSWIVLARGGDRALNGRMSMRNAMLVLGSAGALLFALAPGWTYADGVRRTVIAPPTMTVLGDGGGLGTIIALATVGGAIVAGLVARQCRYHAPTLATVSRSLVGGTLMALGASLVPGGNDKLLLWSLPGATLSGVIAYLAMSATVVALLWIGSLTRFRIHLEEEPDVTPSVPAGGPFTRTTTAASTPPQETGR